MEVKNDKNNEAVLAWKKKKEKKKNKIHTDNGTLIDIVHLSINFERSRVILRELFQTERFVPRTQSARRDNLLNVLYCIITSISLSKRAFHGDSPSANAVSSGRKTSVPTESRISDNRSVWKMNDIPYGRQSFVENKRIKHVLEENKISVSYKLNSVVRARNSVFFH